MATVSDIVAYLAPYVKNCPPVTIEKAINRTIRQFCQDSWWYQKTYNITTVIGQASYTVPVAGDDVVVGLVHAKYDGNDICPWKQFDDTVVWKEGEPGAPLHWRYDPPSALVVDPVPDVVVTNGLQVVAALQLTETATTIPDVIYNHHKRTIEAGALAELYAMPEEVWTNYNLAELHMKKFDLGINDAKRLRLRGFISGSIRIKPRSFLF